jgi:hypothetical protein
MQLGCTLVDIRSRCMHLRIAGYMTYTRPFTSWETDDSLSQMPKYNVAQQRTRSIHGD